MSHAVSSQVVIDIPRDAAWEKLNDISAAHHYVPGIVKTEIVSDQAKGIGASRYVYRNANSYIQETVVEWNEGSGFVINLHKGDKPAPPFKSASFTYLLEDDEPGKTRFTAAMEFELPWGVFGQWLEKRLAGFVEKTIGDVALSMKLYYESGEPTSPAKLKAYKAANK
jgi:hypothetical protein